MTTVSCACEVVNCKASPHQAKTHCSASCEAPTWGEAEATWGEAQATWDGALDWNVRKVGNKMMPVCRDCNHMMAMADDKSGSSDGVGEFDQPGAKQAVGG